MQDQLECQIGSSSVMEPEDETWAALVASFDSLEPHDTLLEALPDDDAGLFGALSLSAPDGTLPRGPPSPEAMPQRGHEQEPTANDVPPTSKRKRIRHSRPFQEIQRLRQTVVDLESLIALHNKRRSSATTQLSATHPTCGEGLSDVWQSIAARQFKFLRDAQLENQQLRDQVRIQHAITRSMLRLIHRASNGAPIHAVPRSLAEGDASIVTFKRQHLMEVASQMYDVVGSVFATDPFSGNADQEFRETVVRQHKGDTIPPGTLLASTSVSRILPRSVNGLSELLWNVNQSDQAFHNAYKLEHREESSHSQSCVYSVTILTPYGPVVCHGVGLCVRYCEADRDVVVTTGSMWPDSTTPSPRNAVAYDFKEWALVKPVSSSAHGRGDHNQVLVRFETSRPSHSFGGDVRSHEQVTVLQHFIAQAHSFIVEQEQRQLDAIMLGRARRASSRTAEQVYV